MALLLLPVNYLWWHYTLAWRDLGQIYRNLLWFVANFFSLGVLTRTLFAPWRRLGEPYPTHFDLGETLAAFFINSLMRLIGVICRLAVIFTGVVVWLVALVLGALTFLLWLVLPLALVALFVYGLILIAQ